MTINDDWKTFFLRHKWIPTAYLRERYGIQRHDVDNFRRKGSVRQLLAPWRVGLDQEPEQLRRIFTDAWRFYITEVSGLYPASGPKDWIPEFIGLRNVKRDPNGMAFLADSKYYKIMCPEMFQNFRTHGFTNIALGTHEFWPGRSFLKECGILPFMFAQTHKTALDFVNIDDMIEHVYLSFIAPTEAGNADFAKEVFLARSNEQGFLSRETLAKFGVPYNFYADEGGLRKVLERICDKYRRDLDLNDSPSTEWSSAQYRKLHPDQDVDRCRYCGLAPVDLHHLLPRAEYPNLTFHDENVVPLCIQVHGLITRNRLTDRQGMEYRAAIVQWNKANDGEKADVFEGVMRGLHAHVYGQTPFAS